ncbi:MAG: hypothetical protein Aurels2KO_51970 [Aureliella sp.]
MHASRLFGNLRIVDAVLGHAPYAHTFGGPPDRDAATPEHTHGIRLHLLHRFDLSDPLIPITIPGLKWLPLYYVFDFRANQVGYTLQSDSFMTTFFPDDDPNVSSEESWPASNFPIEFARHDIKLTTHPFDPRNLDEASEWAGIFGIRHLNASHRAELRKRVEEYCDRVGEYPPNGDDLSEYLCSPFWQGPPNNCCINPKCENHSVPKSLQVFAIVPHEPVPGLEIWGGADVQTIFEICPMCYTIRSSNQCG